MIEVIKLSVPAIDKVKPCQYSNLLIILSAQRTNQQHLGAPMKRETLK